MTREEYLKNLIYARGYNVKSFSDHIGVPYTTLRSSFSRGIGGTSIDLIIKICKDLGITVEELDEAKRGQAFHVTDHEKAVIIAYRQNPQFQAAIDTMLGIADEKKNHLEA